MGLDLIELRRNLHKIPETAFKEFKTAETVAKHLRDLGIEVTEKVAETGVVGLIDRGSDKTVLLRADMDALPITEKNTVDYKSQNEGVMHACGHDVHMTMLIGAAERLIAQKDTLNCNVKFIFQPAEEGIGGALPMIKAGVMENPRVTAALALHVWPSLSVGNILLNSGAVMASPDNFEITLTGRGGHAATPQENNNVILAACDLAMNLQTIANSFTEPVVVSLGSIHSGSSHNIMPDKAEMWGTFRTLSSQTRKKVPELIEQITSEISKIHGVSYGIDLKLLYPPVINDEKIVSLVKNCVENTNKNINIMEMPSPSMCGEDFAYFGELVPSCMVFLGCANEAKGIISPLHSSTFNVDEDCIDIGVKILSDFALNI